MSDGAEFGDEDELSDGAEFGDCVVTETGRQQGGLAGHAVCMEEIRKGEVHLHQEFLRIELGFYWEDCFQIHRA